MHTLSSSLAEDINSNTLQAYMFCFISALRNLSDISIAARLFWLGVGVSQAHPLLFATSTLLVEAAVSCLMRTAPGMNFPSYLLDMQTQTQDTSTSWEEFEDVLEVHFTEENFSFALSSLFAKGLQHQDTYEQTTSQWYPRPVCPLVYSKQKPS